MRKIIDQRREARRQFWYRNAVLRSGWYGPGWSPPPGFYFRFEVR
jgi:hypothetical protein